MVQWLPESILDGWAHAILRAMTHEWEELTRDLAPWIAPDALERLVEALPPGPVRKIDSRTLLLELAQRFGRGSRLGRALRVMNDYRAPTGEYHPMSGTVLIGAVRFMYEAGGRSVSEGDLEHKLQKHLNPQVDPRFSAWEADQTMGFFAYARTAAEVRAQQRSSERAAEWAANYVKARAEKRHFESADDPSVAEARKWLRGRQHSLASNRFQKPKEALAFVEALYAAGAPRVVIENINNDDGQPGAYADSMVVHLPSDPSQRLEILRIINEVGRPETDGGPVTDSGTDSIGLWWD